MQAKLKLPPTVKPERIPDDIIRDLIPSIEDRRVLAKHLIQYRKTEAQWDDYRKKMPDALLKSLAAVNAELRRNGFFALGAEATRDGMHRFTWHQSVDNRVKNPIIPGELCDACERDCHRKNRNGVFRNNAIRCWK